MLLALIPANSYAGNKAVYGEDDRLDYWSLSEEYREIADSVVSIWHDSTVKPAADGRFYGLSTMDGAKNGTPLFMMWYPSGLPLKMSGGASVREAEKKDGYLMADLDAFKGDSGSPVFNARTNYIEVILAGGGEDFDFQENNGGCSVYHVDSQNGGRGEDVTKVSLVRGVLADTLALRDVEIRRKELSATDMDYGDVIPAGNVDFDLKTR